MRVVAVLSSIRPDHVAQKRGINMVIRVWNTFVKCDYHQGVLAEIRIPEQWGQECFQPVREKRDASREVACVNSGRTMAVILNIQRVPAELGYGFRNDIVLKPLGMYKFGKRYRVVRHC